MTELQNDGITELQKDRQGKSSIAPTFSKRGYNYYASFTFTAITAAEKCTLILDSGKTLTK